MVTTIVLLLTINLIGKAAIPSEFVKLETGSLKASLTIAAMDFVLQWLSTIPFLLGGKDKHHDHGAGLAGSTIIVIQHVTQAVLPENTARRWQASHLSQQAQNLYQQICHEPSEDPVLSNENTAKFYQQHNYPAYASWPAIEEKALNYIEENHKLSL